MVETSRQLYARLAGFTILFYMAAGATAVVLINDAYDPGNAAERFSQIKVVQLDYFSYL
jgi:hypothetical protein